ncbi:hypothetical protein HPP92_001176 [Vanilla planifolia]|uniref:Uncharacterized protein n=1 Tax=Vanilla planifolia TaxID=51239 RepID=A0A835S454_VANPL|nr:hypothetical protein HPP92_001176 [Vanilla planifolia]
MAAASLSIRAFHLPSRNRPDSNCIRKTFLQSPFLRHSPALPALYSTGTEATTYTRLPPKEDCQLDPSLLISAPSDVVKLGESTVTAGDYRPKTKLRRSRGLVEERVAVDEGEEGFLGRESGEADEIVSGEGADGAEDVFSDEEVEAPDFAFELDENGEILEGDGKKGVPAIMRCFDRAKIYVKAGDGGNGVVAFRRERYVPYGGPSGGDGGRGGDVYVEADGSMNSLLSFRKNIHFRAGSGGHGHGRNQAGAKGEDVVVKVAPGTVIRESGKGGVEGEFLLELVKPGQRALLLLGGRGGRGNASFKSGTRKVPKIAENGEAGTEMWLDLELKLLADVGIVGAPNAGKSTLLSSISAAQPSIANYPFTTLLPNLGVVSLDHDDAMVVADLPGLLEGAYRGFGLGHEFSTYRKMFCFEYEFDAVRLELELFSPELSEKPYIVAYNKMDLLEAYEKWDSFKEYLQNRGIDPFCMSAMHRQGTHDIICAVHALLQKEKAKKEEKAGWNDYENLNHVAEAIEKQRRVSLSDFEIFHDNNSDTWHVNGAGIQRFVQMTNWRYSESLKRFQLALEACGVNRALLKRGVKEGDTVFVGEMELIWNNENEQEGAPRSKKLISESVRWPQLVERDDTSSRWQRNE